MAAHDPVLRLFTLPGKTAVITGGAMGIGKATARLFAGAGAAVVIADCDLEGAERVAADIRKAGHQALARWFDLADEASVIRLFADLARDPGAVDILVNNAGIYPKYPLDTLTHSNWLGMQEVNVWGCFLCMREAARLMRAAGRGGRIINVSSVGAGRTAVHHQIAYNASKAALDSMSRSAAFEFARDNILVNSVLPGSVQPLDPRPPTPGHMAATGPLMSPGRILLDRHALPDEVAAPILMLAAGAGGYITGQTLVLDGGFCVS